MWWKCIWLGSEGVFVVSIFIMICWEYTSVSESTHMYTVNYVEPLQRSWLCIIDAREHSSACRRYDFNLTDICSETIRTFIFTFDSLTAPLELHKQTWTTFHNEIINHSGWFMIVGWSYRTVGQFWDQQVYYMAHGQLTENILGCEKQTCKCRAWLRLS